MMKFEEHFPVLLNEVLDSFSNVDAQKWIVDCTLGRGGHFLELLKHHNFLIGLDADESSINKVLTILQENYQVLFEEKSDLNYIFLKLKVEDQEKEVYLVNSNFIDLNKVLESLKIKETSGILADLGISTFQIKQSGRGFSFLKPNELLDMRINANEGPKAADLVNALSFNELVSLFRELGEVHDAKKIVSKLIEYRKYKKIETVGDFLSATGLVKKPQGRRTHPATKTFMALRIAVNREFLNLSIFLKQTEQFLKQDTILDVITFHSIEEKIVREFIQENNLKSEEFNSTAQELKDNSSSRSAKLFKIIK